MLTTQFKIFHATDLHPDGGTAFEHSVALARASGAKLFTVHARTRFNDEAQRPMPNAEELLARWSSDVEVDYTPIEHDCCDDPVDTLLDAMRRVLPDLLVLGTHQRTAIGRLLHESVSHALAVNSEVPTLFLPIGQPGFLGAAGEVTIRRVLVPVGDDEDFAVAIPAAAQLAERIGLSELDFHVLHVGDPGVLANQFAPEHTGWNWRFVDAQGDLTSALQRYAEDEAIDLVVMATRGQNGILDVLRGTHTPQMLQRTNCPRLVVPAHTGAGAFP